MQFYSHKDGYRLAYHDVIGSGPTVIWCGGLKSDMEGGKATHLHKWAEDNHHSYIRFDYFGHGRSDGDFIAGTISRWASDVGEMISRAPHKYVVLIGSSMGGWASLLAALDNPERVKGLVLIAPAPDFTEKLTYSGFSDQQKEDLEMDGVVYIPSDYDEPYAYSKALIEDGRARQILDAPIKFSGPVRILQGADDTVVPWDYALQLVETLDSEDVSYTLIKGGDHSLSRPPDLERLKTALLDVLGSLA